MEPNCIFCKIINKTIPAAIIYEDQNVLGFKDINPQADIHYLFIPKKHYESLAHVPESEMDVLKNIFVALNKVAVQEGVSKSGYKTSIHTGKGGGQVVFHLHAHLLANK